MPSCVHVRVPICSEFPVRNNSNNVVARVVVISSRKRRTNEPRGSGAAGMHAYDRSSWASAAHTTRPGSSWSQPTDAIETRMNIAAVQVRIPARGTWGAARTRVGQYLKAKGPWPARVSHELSCQPRQESGKVPTDLRSTRRRCTTCTALQKER